MSRRPRVRAPELHGRGWLNTGGTPYSIGDLRGRFVLLDFWAFCCVNCLHVLDELRPLEEKYAGELVVVGVHSPKFAHEADPDALVAAVSRYSVEHPVLDDPDLVTWQAYTARAWPTLVLVDPEGYVVAQYAGEGHAHAIDALLGELREEHLARGTLQPDDSPYVAPPAAAGDLRFPAKVVALPGRWVPRRRRRSPQPRRAGPRCLDRRPADRLRGAWPRGRIGRRGAVLRARTASASCRRPSPRLWATTSWSPTPSTTRCAACGWPTGRSARWPATGGSCSPARPGRRDRCRVPGTSTWCHDRVWVAMAGIHQLWTYDPVSGAADVAAGTTNEGLVDGPLADAWFAQTSGLAADGERLWLADSETSSVRYVSAGAVHTAVGTGLFDFGLRDGAADQALLQHPLGVTVLPDGAVAVCDTYNGAVRVLRDGAVSTLATGLAEPSGAVVDGEHLLVVESAAHRLTRVPLGGAAQVEGFASRTQRPPTDVRGGPLEIVVDFTPPPGQKVDDRFGPPSQLLVSATPPALLASGDGRGTALSRTVAIDPAVGDGVLHVAARAASCDAEGGEGAACHLHQQDWGVPVRVTTDGETRLVLPLSAG